MQDATVSLAAAISDKEREPLANVTVRWEGADELFVDVFEEAFASYEDLSLVLERVTVDRSITTDLPSPARLVAGYAAAEVSVDLAGDLNDVPVTRLLSSYDSASPLAGVKRLNSAFEVELGFRGSAGAEYVPAFVGRTRELTVEPRSGTVTVTGLDERSRFSGRSPLPVVVADTMDTVSPTIKPGLDGAYFIDYIARGCGFYASPPPRANVVASVPLHGSTWPEVGTLILSQRDDPDSPGGLAIPTFGQGHFNEAMTDGYMSVTPAGAGVSTADGATLFMECWAYLHPGRAGDIYLVIGSHQPGALPSVGLYVTPAGVLGFAVTRNDAGGVFADILSGPTVPDETWQRIRCFVSFTATGVSATFQVGDAPPVGPLTVATASVPTASLLTEIGPECGPTSASIEAWQVTRETSIDWDETFTPTAILDPSLNTLTATPAAEYADNWQLLSDFAAAESGFVALDETGRLVFRNRDHMTGGAAVATISSTDSLKDIGSTESVDTVRNKIRVPSRPVRLITDQQFVWTAAEIYKVPKNGSLTVRAAPENLVYEIKTDTVAYWPVGGAIPAGVIWRGNRNMDGSGADVTNLTGTVTRIDHTTFEIVLTNPNPYGVHLVHPTASTLAGTPAVQMWGRWITPVTSDSSGDATGYITAEVSDAASAASYGDQVLDLPVTAMRQTRAAAEDLATHLLAALKDPRPVLKRVDVVADPRRQLGDRVTVVEPDGMAVDDDFWVIGISTTYDGSGMSQQLDLRAV